MSEHAKTKIGTGPCVRERICRRLQTIGRTLAGTRGERIANHISWAIRCGRIDYCTDPTCLDCAPTG
ncbi:hypothetical protein [Streptomyces tsukubensis]|uniref:hypothetical protein n=1 Tax=Streptomyces tsukubensis TaxID=83656 RepID=UPI00344DC845